MNDDLQQYRQEMIVLANQAALITEKAISLAERVGKTAKRDANGISMAKAYIGLRYVFDAMKESLKDLNAHHDKWRKVIIPHIFEDLGVTNIPIASFGRRVQVSTKQRCSILSDRKEGALGWLRKEGYGDSIYETVQAGRLDNIAKEILTESGLEMPDNFFRVYDDVTTSAVKIKES